MVEKITIAQGYIAGKHLLDKYLNMLTDEEDVFTLAMMSGDMDFGEGCDYSSDPAVWDAYFNHAKDMIFGDVMVTKDTEISVKDAFEAFRKLLISHNRFLNNHDVALFKRFATEVSFLPSCNTWKDFIFFAKQAREGEIDAVYTGPNEKKKAKYKSWLLK